MKGWQQFLVRRTNSGRCIAFDFRVAAREGPNGLVRASPKRLLGVVMNGVPSRAKNEGASRAGGLRTAGDLRAPSFRRHPPAKSPPLGGFPPGGIYQKGIALQKVCLVGQNTTQLVPGLKVLDKPRFKWTWALKQIP